MNKNKFLYFLSRFFILSFFAAVTVATSYKRADESLFIAKTYSTTSNCSNASFTSGIISVRGGQIDSPLGTTFLDLGFPSVTVSIGTDISGTDAFGFTRTCLYSQSVISNSVTSIYDCQENGLSVCTINLIHLD